MEGGKINKNIYFFFISEPNFPAILNLELSTVLEAYRQRILISTRYYLIITKYFNPGSKNPALVILKLNRV